MLSWLQLNSVINVNIKRLVKSVSYSVINVNIKRLVKSTTNRIEKCELVLSWLQLYKCKYCRGLQVGRTQDPNTLSLRAYYLLVL